MIVKILFNTTIISMGGLSGGLAYFMFSDLNRIYIIQTQKFNTQLNSINQLLNPGFIMGTALGICYAYTGRTLMDNIYLGLGGMFKDQIQSSITGAK